MPLESIERTIDTDVAAQCSGRRGWTSRRRIAWR